MNRDGATAVGRPGPDDDNVATADADAFGDTGRFGAVAEQRREIHWPTVLVAGAVAVVVSSLMLTLGVIGLHRSADQPPEVVVAVDPRGAVTVDGQTVVEGAASSSVSSSLSSSGEPTDTDTDTDAPAPTSDGPAPAGEDGGGLSPATGVPTSPDDHADSDESEPDPGPEAPAEPAGEPRSGWTPPTPLPADFAVTVDEPTLDDLNAIVHLLVATPAPDEAKARNLEAGHGGVVVPRTVYNLGVFRAPQGWKRITGPIERNGDEITATLHSESAGRPSITTPVVFVRSGGTWTLSTRSVCEGVKTIGLPVGCGA